MSGFAAFGRLLAIIAEPCEAFPQGADPDDVRAVTAALERARVVGALDASGMGWECWPFKSDGSQGAQCMVYRPGNAPLQFNGATADAARAAAAKAVEAGEV